MSYIINTITADCPAGKYLTVSGCEKCGPGTYSTVAAYSCTSCPSGYTSAAGSTTIENCDGGKFLLWMYAFIYKMLY